MSRDPVPEWFGKGEAEPPKPRGSAEARSSIGCAGPVAGLILMGAIGAGVFFMLQRPTAKNTAATVTAVATPEPVPIPVPTPPPPPEVVTAPTVEPPATVEPPVDPAEVPSAPVTDGTERLSGAKIKLVIDNSRKRFQACYENALNYAPEAAGTVRLSITISPAGRVDVASASQTGDLPPQVSACMTKIARTLKFPESPAQTTVTVPYVFKSAH